MGDKKRKNVKSLASGVVPQFHPNDYVLVYIYWIQNMDYKCSFQY